MAAGSEPGPFQRFLGLGPFHGIPRLWIARGCRRRAPRHHAGWRQSWSFRGYQAVHAFRQYASFDPRCRRRGPTFHAQRQHKTFDTECWHAAFHGQHTQRWHAPLNSVCFHPSFHRGRGIALSGRRQTARCVGRKRGVWWRR